MRHIVRFLGFIFATGTILFVVAACAGAVLVWEFGRDLPDYSALKDYEPPVMTRVHASDGSLIAQAAYLAALPKAPNNYHPFLKRERAVERRNWVIDRMAENGVISREDGEKAKAEPLGVNPRVLSPNAFAAGYFAEEVRRVLGE